MFMVAIAIINPMIPTNSGIEMCRNRSPVLSACLALIKPMILLGRDPFDH